MYVKQYRVQQAPRTLQAELAKIVLDKGKVTRYRSAQQNQDGSKPILSRSEITDSMLHEIAVK